MTDRYDAGRASTSEDNKSNKYSWLLGSCNILRVNYRELNYPDEVVVVSILLEKDGKQVWITPWTRERQNDSGDKSIIETLSLH